MLLVVVYDARIESSTSINLKQQESHIKPELLYIDVLEESEPNDGEVMIIPRDFGDRDNGPDIRSCEMGLIKINITNPVQVWQSNNNFALKFSILDF